MKKSMFILTLSLLFVFSTCSTVFAFQPVTHHIIIKKSAEDLPEDSIIRNAVLNNLDIATWGSNGPDIGYAQVRKMLGGYSKWGDLYHYHKTGEFAKELLREALLSGDEKQIAFAAGWLTHEIADMEGHKLFVNPEAGPAINHPEFDEIHGVLEKNADPYVWANIGGMDIDNYSTSHTPNLFSSVSEIPFDFLSKVTKSVYSENLDISFLKLCAYTYKTGLETGIGYNYKNYDDAMNILNQNNRTQRLEEAVHNAINWSSHLFEKAEAGDYSSFTSRWNLDVGRSSSPISSITMKIKTMDVMWAGTDDDIYFGLTTNSGETFEYFLDNEVYNDFERGDNDNYYIYFDDFKVKPSDVKEIYLKKVDNGKPGGDWDLGSATLYFNGKEVFTESINKEINDTYTTWKKQLDLNDSDYNISPDLLPWD